MHPGPMNEGVEIAADVAAGAQSRDHRPGHATASRSGWRCCTCSPGSDADDGRGGSAAGAASARSSPTSRSARAWLVDPASGREGPGEIVVRDGILEAVTWLDGGEADGIDAHGSWSRRASSTCTPHLREPGNEDAETIATGLAAAAHGGFTTVCAMPNTTPALDEPGGARADPRRPRRVRVAGRAARLRRGDGRPGGETARRARRAGGRRRGRVLATTGRRSVRGAPAERAGVRGRARAADRRPPRGRRR